MSFTRLDSLGKSELSRYEDLSLDLQGFNRFSKRAIQFKNAGNYLNDPIISGGSLDSSTEIGGASVASIAKQVGSDEAVLVYNLGGVRQIPVERADGTVVDIAQGFKNSGTPKCLYKFNMDGRDVGKDVVFTFDFYMTTTDLNRVVKLKVDFNVIDPSADINPAAFTGSVSQEFTILDNANKKIRVTGSTLKVKESFLTNQKQILQVILSRENSGLVGTNHSGEFCLINLRLSQ